jgi:AraC-like DNA-binding protein
MTQPPLRQHLEAAALPRHRHALGYLAVVLAGGYLEAGDGGRVRARTGDAIVHRPFEAHLNCVPAAGAEVLNLPLADADLPAFGRIADPDRLARAAERDLTGAADLARDAFQIAEPEADWPDDLAAALTAGPRPALRAWARERGISPEHLSRGFRQAYGVSPQRFGWEARARTAWRSVMASDAPLAAIALEAGFCDQAHLTRAVAALTGRPPGAWRRSTAFKT